jgi:hypothetical protein
VVRAFPSEERRVLEGCCGDDADAKHIGRTGDAQGTKGRARRTSWVIGWQAELRVESGGCVRGRGARKGFNTPNILGFLLVLRYLCRLRLHQAAQACLSTPANERPTGEWHILPAFVSEASGTVNVKVRKAPVSRLYSHYHPMLPAPAAPLLAAT